VRADGGASNCGYAAPMRLSTITAALAPLVVTAISSAQEQLAPPQPAFEPKTSPVIGYLVIAVLFGIIVALSLMPSKRSHQDL
jgi:hypothetical protein